VKPFAHVEAVEVFSQVFCYQKFVEILPSQLSSDVKKDFGLLQAKNLQQQQMVLFGLFEYTNQLRQ
jgi:hypothetical protein